MMLDTIIHSFKYLTIGLFRYLKTWLGILGLILTAALLFRHHIEKQVQKPWKRCRKEQLEFYQD